MNTTDNNNNNGKRISTFADMPHLWRVSSSTTQTISSALEHYSRGFISYELSQIDTVKALYDFTLKEVEGKRLYKEVFEKVWSLLLYKSTTITERVNTYSQQTMFFVKKNDSDNKIGNICRANGKATDYYIEGHCNTFAEQCESFCNACKALGVDGNYLNVSDKKVRMSNKEAKSAYEAKEIERRNRDYNDICDMLTDGESPKSIERAKRRFMEDYNISFEEYKA